MYRQIMGANRLASPDYKTEVMERFNLQAAPIEGLQLYGVIDALAPDTKRSQIWTEAEKLMALMNNHPAFQIRTYTQDMRHPYKLRSIAGDAFGGGFSGISKMLTFYNQMCVIYRAAESIARDFHPFTSTKSLLAQLKQASRNMATLEKRFPRDVLITEFSDRLSHEIRLELGDTAAHHQMESEMEALARDSLNPFAKYPLF